MAADKLPLELQQQIFQHLDGTSFHAARSVSRWWRYASTESVTLARQLQKLPISPPVEAASCSPAQLQRLFSEAAHTLMLGLKTTRERDSLGTLTPWLTGPRICSTSNGNRTVTLNDRTISLFDTTTLPHKLITQRRLNDLKETVGSGPWFKITPSTSHELALSSNGNLLAVALERTIQIYDLTAEPDSYTVNEYLPSASGHYIAGLDFEQDDHVLRVRLNGKGTVLYCGTPRGASSKSNDKAGIDHWKSKAGLKHCFLDSSLLKLPAAEAGDLTSPSRISGLQLLRPFQGGYLFASQKHGGGAPSRYMLGHVKSSVPHNAKELVVEPGSTTVLAHLPSFLSSWETTLNTRANNHRGQWENMPSAHEHHPHFALSLDNSMLALAEKDKKRVRPSSMHQIFNFRIPHEKSLERLIKEASSRRQGADTERENFLERLESRTKRQKIAEGAVTGELVETKYDVCRLPLCLATVTGELTDLGFAGLDGEESGRGAKLRVSTTDATRSWSLVEG
ncbi:hypothetical protein MBLNU230_g1154t1 [Neophaeotheca triangularis]